MRRRLCLVELKAYCLLDIAFAPSDDSARGDRAGCTFVDFIHDDSMFSSIHIFHEDTHFVFVQILKNVLDV